MEPRSRDVRALVAALLVSGAACSGSESGNEPEASAPASVTTAVPAFPTLATVAPIVVTEPPLTPPPNREPPPTLPAGDESFGLRWFAPLDGFVVDTEFADDTIYAAVERPPALEVAAIDRDDGEVRWLVTLSEDATWNSTFSLGPTSDGVMTSYEDDGGGHLLLLDGASGATRWDVPLPGSAYELRGEVVDGVGHLLPTELQRMMVDLDTGAAVDSIDIDFAIGNRGAVQEGSVLRVDLDPFDPATGGTEIDLGSDADLVGVVEFSDTIVTLGDDGRVSGYANGERHWTLDVNDLDVRDVGLEGDLLLVHAAPASTPEEEWHVYRIIDGEVVPVTGLPAGLVPEATGRIGASPVLVGRIGEDQGRLIGFDEARADVIGEFELAASDELEVIGNHILLGDEEGGLLTVLALDGLTEQQQIGVSGDSPGRAYHFGDSFLLVAEGADLMLYE